MRRGWRTVFDRHLVDGLTVDERIARLEGGLERLRRAEITLAVQLLAQFEASERRRQLPFYRRWFTKGSRAC